MKDPAKIVTIVGVALSIGIGVFVIWYRSKVDTNPTYVLGKVTRVTEPGENGPVYYYFYKFNGKTYKSSVEGFFALCDSLMIIKVSKSNPQYCLYTHFKVPSCICDENKMDSSWDVLPKCWTR